MFQRQKPLAHQHTAPHRTLKTLLSLEESEGLDAVDFRSGDERSNAAPGEPRSYNVGPGHRLHFDREGTKSYAILKRISTETGDTLPAHLMKFFLSDNWSLTSNYGDFIYGSKLMAWPGIWLAFDEPRLCDLFIEEMRRDTHG